MLYSKFSAASCYSMTARSSRRIAISSEQTMPLAAMAEWQRQCPSSARQTATSTAHVNHHPHLLTQATDMQTLSAKTLAPYSVRFFSSSAGPNVLPTSTSPMSTSNSNSHAAAAPPSPSNPSSSSNSTSSSPSPSPIVDRIRLHGLRFYGHHGVYEYERVSGQRFEVDIVLEVADLTQAGEKDDLQGTIDYGVVADVIRGRMEGSPVKLLECLALTIIDDLFDRFDASRLSSVDITLRKPNVNLGCILQHAAVQMKRTRQQRQCQRNKEQ